MKTSTRIQDAYPFLNKIMAIIGLCVLQQAAVQDFISTELTAADSAQGKLSDDESLPELQSRILEAVQRSTPSVVAVRAATAPVDKPATQRDFASGVVISEDGLVLSQFHVSHQTADGAVPPGTKTVVVLPDERSVEAELFGYDKFHDISLLKLAPGRYSFSPLTDVNVELGERVLKIGHPTGLIRGRTAPVRLGKVVSASPSVFDMDCATVGGDSGGPLFNLRGELIGIIRSSILHEAVHSASGHSRSRGVLPFSVTSTKQLRASLGDLEQRSTIGDATLNSPEYVSMTTELKGQSVLHAEDWSQGDRQLNRFSGLFDQRSVVSVLRDEVPVAMATAVGTDLVITRASQLPAEIVVECHDQRRVAATIVGISLEYDLALLRIDDAELIPVDLEAGNPPVGALVFAPGRAKPVIAAGVVSVTTRSLNVSPPTRIERSKRPEANPPSILGSPVSGRGYWVEFVEGAAFDSGIRAGDVILSIDGRSIYELSDLAMAVAQRTIGESVPTVLIREGVRKTVDLKLAGKDANLFNARPEGYPVVFEHDTPLIPSECGGPVVGLDGKVLGVTLGRVNVHGCQSIPAPVLRDLIPALKSGKGRDAMAPESPPLTVQRDAKDSPVDTPLDEIIRELRNRNAAFQSLFVQYRKTVEPIVDPLTAASWGVLPFRNDWEVHRFAFEGDKRMFGSIRPGATAYAVPPQLVEAAAGMPSAEKEQWNRFLRMTQENEKANGRASWFLSMSSRLNATVSTFDGKQAWIQAGGMPQAAPVEPFLFISDPELLEGLGLRPLDPGATGDVRAGQQSYWYPNNFERYSEAHVRPRTEFVDSAECVVIDAVRTPHDAFPESKFTETMWLDPQIRYTPRRTELRDRGNLVIRRNHSEFEEFAEGCWLPWKTIHEIGVPAWVEPRLQDSPAYRIRIQLERAVINQAIPAWFDPKKNAAGLK